jgi:hypothetical protein
MVIVVYVLLVLNDPFLQLRLVYCVELLLLNG